MPWWAYIAIGVWFVTLFLLGLGTVARAADLASEVLYERESRKRS
jgi:hypothetical protein